MSGCDSSSSSVPKRTRSGSLILAERVRESLSIGVLREFPTQGVEQTVERLSALLVAARPDHNGTRGIRIQTDDETFTFSVGPELDGDAWWASVCRWERSNMADMSIHARDAHAVGKAVRGQNARVRETLVNAWRAEHGADTDACKIWWELPRQGDGHFLIIELRQAQ